MKEKQEAMRKQLSQILVEGTSGTSNEVRVTVSAAREVKNIEIDEAFYAEADREQVEDMVLVAMNRALLAATEKEAEESQKMLKDMLPPGMDNLGGLFS